ncbi:conserved hypothetical protein [Arthrobacter sp. 9V]|uniref:hypothetical protein n=1 Tax=Arthrobacter sp. 9V TaxID=2653132 RepID=UPI0012F0B092|nr:hypothetical protein [Arthrobacter sp. 9V]VXB25265.1 conserved hypothetical protein [Arthrobacter sp. 9V]
MVTTDAGNSQPTETRMIGRALRLAPSRAHILGLERSTIRRRLVENPAFRDGPLHVITGGRQEGKTTLAMQWLLDAPDGTERVLVVANSDQASHIRREHGLKQKDPRIIGYRTLINQGPREGVQYGIDDTAEVLTRLLGLTETPHLLTVGYAAPWQG